MFYFLYIAEQIPTLIELEEGKFKEVRDKKIAWVGTQWSQEFYYKSLKPPPDATPTTKVVNRVPHMLIGQIENPYGGIFRIDYDNDYKKVQKVWTLLKWEW